jgi:hypothetical protein
MEITVEVKLLFATSFPRGLNICKESAVEIHWKGVELGESFPG